MSGACPPREWEAAARGDSRFSFDEASEGCPAGAVWEAPVNLEVSRASGLGQLGSGTVIALGAVRGREEEKAGTEPRGLTTFQGWPGRRALEGFWRMLTM